MKSLKFKPELIPDIIDGNKKSTWRVNDDKNLSVNDEVEFLNGETDEAFGWALIDRVLQDRLGTVELKQDKHQGYNSREELYDKFRGYYGTEVDADTPVKIIEYTFHAYDQPKKKAAELSEAKLFTDGGSRGNPGPSAIAFVISKVDDTVVEKSGEYIGDTTNNQAEYQALKAGLKRAQELGVKELIVNMDSELVVKQINGLYKMKNEGLLPHYNEVKQLAGQFEQITFQHVPRALNAAADKEVNRILDAQK